MFRLLLFALLFNNLSAENERLPQIVCRDARGESFPLKLERFAMDVAIHEDLAETTLTLTFRNETSRQLEGDFLLPLPPHANISGYALEVKGEFREAVAVEKERAKLAYETIKRRGIDPGIVEKVADNLYRTRIFPIERNSTKSVRISYLEYLTIDGPEPFRPTYRYPFNLTSEVGEISVTVKSPKEATISHPDLEFLETNDGDMKAVLKKKTLSGDLTIESKSPHRPLILFSKDDRSRRIAYLTLDRTAVQDWRGTSENPVAPLRASPKKVKILWDASRSMAKTDFTSVHEYLEAFFTKCPDLEVQLIILRNEAQQSGDFQINNGDWSKLKTTLQDIDYDGSSSLQGFGGFYQDLTVLITDGKATHWTDDISNITPGRPLVALLTGAHRSTVLDNLTLRSGGHALALNELTPQDALTKTFQQSFHIHSSQRRIEFVPLPSSPPHVYRYLIKGNFIDAEKLQVAIGETEFSNLAVESSTAPREVLEQLSGIATLNLLEEQNAPAHEIIEHCKKHTLASDHTSLIVLERFADHLAFRIPPPEPDLLLKYQKELRERDSQNYRYFAEVWAEALNRHRYKFPGIEIIIFDDLKRIRTFNQAQKQAFDPDKLDPAITQAFSHWEQEALLMLEESDESKKDDKWIKAAVAHRTKARDLGDLRAKPKDSITVSVRGFVKRPGTFALDNTATLKEAAQKANPFYRENLSRVALYRSGTKTLYNTLSKNYQDVPLLPGDMIVLEERPSSMWGHMDPFSSSDSSPRGHHNEPAVVSQPSPRTATSHPTPLALQNLNGAMPFGQKATEETQASALNPIPIALHAMALHEKGKPEAAAQHLSNLRELFGGNIAALRLEAFVRSRWGESKTSVKIYRELLEQNPEDSLTTRLLADHLISQGERAFARKSYQSFIDHLKDKKSFFPAVILLADRNNLTDNVSGTAQLIRLPSELRVVVSNLHPHPSFRLSVTDPTGFITTHNEISPTGVSVNSFIGLHEVTDRETIKGDYQLSARCDREQLLEITIYRNFATDKEEVTRRTIKLPASNKGSSTLLESIEIK